jgi:hypothetical protein
MDDSIWFAVSTIMVFTGVVLFRLLVNVTKDTPKITNIPNPKHLDIGNKIAIHIDGKYSHKAVTSHNLRIIEHAILKKFSMVDVDVVYCHVYGREGLLKFKVHYMVDKSLSYLLYYYDGEWSVNPINYAKVK